jgi:hypothetical protein
MKLGMSTGYGTSSARMLLLSLDFKFVIINNNGKIWSQMYVHLYMKCLLLLSKFNANLSELPSVCQNSKYEIWPKSF